MPSDRGGDLLDGATGLLGGLRHLLRGGTEPRGRVRKARDEPAQLAGHGREGAAEDVALGARLRLDGQVAARDARGGVGRLAQVGDHPLEGLGQRPDLVAAAHVEVLLEVALGDRVGGDDHAAHGAGHGGEEGQEEVGGERDAEPDDDVGASCAGAQAIDAGGQQIVERRGQSRLERREVRHGVPAEDGRRRPVGAAVHSARELERERAGRARDLRQGRGEGGAQARVAGVGVRRAQAGADGVDGARQDALVDGEGDPLGLGAVARGDHRDLAAADAPGGVERERRLVDQRVHHVVRVEVRIEDQVGLVAGLHDERDGGRGQAPVGVERAARVDGLGGDGGPDRRAQAPPHRARPELRADARVGRVERGGRARHGRARGGQRRDRLPVASGGSDGERARRGQVGQQSLGGHDLLDPHALLGAERDLGVLLGAELPRRVERRRDEDERDEHELVRQAQAAEHGDGRAQQEGGQGTHHAKMVGWRGGVLERQEA